MSDLRRQKRKAIRESKKNLTTTKIDDNLAIILDAYLMDERYFQKQLDLCYELKMDYPPKAKSGYELPLFNKNPITNEIEIHNKSAELFIAYQVTQQLAESAIGLDDESDDYKSILLFLTAIDRDPLFATYIYNLMQIGDEKGKEFSEVINDNQEEIIKKFNTIFVDIK